jgi:hypothetical protein
MYKATRKWRVQLSSADEEALWRMVTSGVAPARQIARARILLKAHQGLRDVDIAEALDVSRPLIHIVRKAYATSGLAAAVERKPQPDRPQAKRLDGQREAHLIALACSPAPEGHVRWTLRLLADKAVELGICEHLGKTTVGDALKKTRSSPGRTSSGAFRRKRRPTLSAAWKTS